ncbi:hypothetical protein [Embleya sp. NPDC059237]|uniref:hypothetical protein n=1 Tax=Embleya sp. NPDC059237 TaxID=3346784 RepID=UPI0036A3CC0E
MKKIGRVLTAAFVAGSSLVGSLALAAPANAGSASNSWGAGDYHAGSDGLAEGYGALVWGSACNGLSAVKFYVQLTRTSDKVKIRSTTSWPSNGNTYSQSFQNSVSPGTWYYVRWFGQDVNENNGFSAPCSSAGFQSYA